VLETLGGNSRFQFDVGEALKTGFYTSGTTGCGKTDIAMYCVDALREEGVNVFIFDPSQDWDARYRSDLLHVSFKAHNPYASVVNNLSELRLSTSIIDISSLTVLQTQEVAEAFAWMLYKHQAELKPEQRKKYFIVYEEAQTVFPQGALRAKRLQNVVRLLTQGRNYKIRIGMITQFAAMLDKDGMKYQRQRYFGWTDEFNDRKYISHFLGDEAAESLKFLKSGEFLYYEPTSGTLKKIRIDPYEIGSKTL
jgi:DNA helicase HerA-like ATPase